VKQFGFYLQGVYENCENLLSVCKDHKGDIYSEPIVQMSIVGKPHIERITVESIKTGSHFQNKFSTKRQRR